MICNLSNDLTGIKQVLVCVEGRDAKDFLQKQLSNDIFALVENNAQINAYCTHQGRVIALFRVFLLNKKYYLLLPSDLVAKTLKRLQMFVLNSEVIFEVVDDLLVLGFLDEDVPDGLGQTVVYSCRQTLCLIAKTVLGSLNIDSSQDWLMASINLGLPEIVSQTSEVFIPQMLNLDLKEVNGVSFTKGCYPGQEIVARLHYLGKSKRRLIQLKSTNKMCIGNKIIVQKSQSLKESGKVILVALKQGIYYCLATIEVALQDEYIQLETGHKLEKYENE